MTTLPCPPAAMMIEALKTSLGEVSSSLQTQPQQQQEPRPVQVPQPEDLRPQDLLLNCPGLSVNVLQPSTLDILNMLLRVALINTSNPPIIQPTVQPSLIPNNDDSSSHLLRDLLTGGDLRKVRNRSGLIDPQIGSNTVRCVKTDHSSSSSMTDVAELTKTPNQSTTQSDSKRSLDHTNEESSILAELISRPISPVSSEPDPLRRRSADNQLMVTCTTVCRNQIFDWLRQADSFVAQHGRSIPLGALMATVISPSSIVNGCRGVSPVPASVRHMLRKVWHQLLLLSIMEHTFIPLTTNRPIPSDPIGSMLSNDTNQPIRERLLSAISSLVELEQTECPLPDVTLVHNLTTLVNLSNQMKLNKEMYKLMRFCVLAQAGHPHHFESTYDECLIALELCITGTVGAPPMSSVLKLLHRLHCFDPSTLKLFFRLSADEPVSTGTKRKAPFRGRANTVAGGKATRFDWHRPRSGTLPAKHS